MIIWGDLHTTNLITYSIIELPPLVPPSGVAAVITWVILLYRYAAAVITRVILLYRCFHGKWYLSSSVPFRLVPTAPKAVHGTACSHNCDVSLSLVYLQSPSLELHAFLLACFLAFLLPVSVRDRRRCRNALAEWMKVKELSSLVTICTAPKLPKTIAARERYTARFSWVFPEYLLNQYTKFTN